MSVSNVAVYLNIFYGKLFSGLPDNLHSDLVFYSVPSLFLLLLHHMAYTRQYLELLSFILREGRICSVVAGTSLNLLCLSGPGGLGSRPLGGRFQIHFHLVKIDFPGSGSFANILSPEKLNRNLPLLGMWKRRENAGTVPPPHRTGKGKILPSPP